MDVTAAPAGVVFSDVAAGYGFSCGARADSGAIVCWGAAQPAGTPPAGPFVSIAGGEQVACGVRTNGSVACWGSNADNRATPPAFPRPKQHAAPLLGGAALVLLAPRGAGV